MAGHKCGGASDVREADEGTKNITDLVRHQVEEVANKKFDHFEPTHYRSQVVAGANYFIKVKVAASEFVHLRVFRNLKQELLLHGVLLNKTEADPLEYFDQNTHDKPAICTHDHKH